MSPLVSPVKGEVSDIAYESVGQFSREQNEAQAENTQKNENMNIRAATIHIMGDMVQSIGVISAAIIIKVRPDWQIADPICTYIFSFLVLLTTVPIFMECTHIIMEGTAEDIEVSELYNEILSLGSVQTVHDFHCWSLAGGKNILSCHIRSKF